MGPLFLQTAIADQRVAENGQPPWETIALDAVVRLPGISRHVYAETVRYGDFLRSGGESVRYYHLLAYPRGHALSIPASGQSRLISGLYEGRQVILARAPRPLEAILAEELDRAKPVLMASHALVKLVTEHEEIIVRFNCLEAFPHHYTISASLRIPELFLLQSPYAQPFDQLLEQHSSMVGPAFQAIPCPTTDATLVIDFPRDNQSVSQAKIQFTNEHEIQLNAPQVFLVP